VKNEKKEEKTAKRLELNRLERLQNKLLSGAAAHSSFLNGFSASFSLSLCVCVRPQNGNVVATKKPVLLCHI